MEINELKSSLEKVKETKDILSDIEKQLDTNPELQVSEPQGLMSAKSYKKKFVDPLIKKLKAIIRTVVAKSYEGWENYHRININNGRLYRENETLRSENQKLKDVNGQLKEENKAYKLLVKVFGRKRLDELFVQAKTIKNKSNQRNER